MSESAPPPWRRHCVVIGGGLAGLATACALLDAGHLVTTVEKRPFLGGRAFSFVDPETGQEVDNGQHVFLGCCTEYIAFLQRLGVYQRTHLQPRLRLEVRSPDGGKGVLSAWPFLPAPLHLLPSFLVYPHLGWRDKLRVLATLLETSRLDRERHREELEGQTFLEWLERRGHSERAVRHFWELIILPTLNDRVEHASAYMALMVFQEGLLRGRHSGAIGYSRAGLTALISDAARQYVQEHGGKLSLDAQVNGLAVENGRVTAAELAGGQRLQGDVFISALPWDVLPRLLPPAWAEHPFFASAKGLEAAPIVGIHVWYDRPVMEGDLLAFLDSPVQWVFNKSRIMGLAGPSQYLCVSVSGAWQFADMGKAELRELFVRELARLFPRAQDAEVQRFLAVKQLAATFRSVPGAEALRPPQATPIPNLFLAGEWTRTGWPSTMESAVRSGLLAAREVAQVLVAESGGGPRISAGATP
ncbi:MAG: FAD-dependent oxidoreductase [Chloroflexi bacterium]|nr:FAD-dependent oxidoreductase [Chloroflexota bacterium]